MKNYVFTLLSIILLAGCFEIDEPVPEETTTIIVEVVNNDGEYRTGDVLTVHYSDGYIMFGNSGSWDVGEIDVEGPFEYTFTQKEDYSYKAYLTTKRGLKLECVEPDEKKLKPGFINEVRFKYKCE